MPVPVPVPVLVLSLSLGLSSGLGLGSAVVRTRKKWLYVLRCLVGETTLHCIALHRTLQIPRKAKGAEALLYSDGGRLRIASKIFFFCSDDGVWLRDCLEPIFLRDKDKDSLSSGDIPYSHPM